MGDRIAIMGSGALGSYAAAFLTREGEDVTIIDMWPEHVETMRRQGLRASGSQGDFTVPVNAMHLTDAQGITEATNAGIPIIGIANTDNVTSKLDLVIPANNRGRKSLATISWLLAREILQDSETMKYEIEDFETKTAEVEEEL